MLVRARAAVTLGAVLQTVPQLRTVLTRELSSSAAVLAGGKIQKPRHSDRAAVKARRAGIAGDERSGPSRFGRPVGSSRMGAGRDGFSQRYDSRPSFDNGRDGRSTGYGRVREDGGHRFENRDRRAGEDRYRGDRRERDDRRSGYTPRSSNQAPTTSRRLADLPIPRKPGSGSLRSEKRNDIPTLGRQTLETPNASRLAAAAAAATPQPFTSFELHPALLDGLKTMYGPSGKTTPIQSLSLGRLLSSNGKKVAILGAETGSGKTLAYLLPMLNSLKATDAYVSPETAESRALDTAPAFLRPDVDSTHTAHGPLAPRGIVLAPTHELTRQITAAVKTLCHGLKLSSVGGSSTKGPVTREGSVDVFAATGGTVRRMLRLKRDGEEIEEWDAPSRRGAVEEGEEADEFAEERTSRTREAKVRLRLDRVEWVVIDEADIMLGPDHLEETLGMLNMIPPEASILLTTATLPPSLLHAIAQPPLNARKFAQLLSPGMHKLPKGLSTTFVTRAETRGNVNADVVKRIQRAFADDALDASLAKRAVAAAQASVPPKTKAIVFCNADAKVKRVGEALKEKGLSCLVWTGDSDDRVRGTNGPLAQFLSSPTSAAQPPSAAAGAAGEDDPRVLVTTSLLSRGLDFSPRVSTVVLLEPPRDTLDFIHRAGRAGRAGRKGRVVVYGMGEGRAGSLGRTANGFGMRRGGAKGRAEGINVEEVVRGRRAPKQGRSFR